METKDKKGRTRLYRIWVDMKQRCDNPNYIGYKYWGGKGVTICEQWRVFANFHKWAHDNGYNDDLTIDRIRSDGNYEPNNCRWATYKEQANNLSSNRYITIDNECLSIAEWCKRYNISKASVYRRIKNYGWSFKDAITTPNFSAHNANKNLRKQWNKSKCIALIAESENETLYFESTRDVEERGFDRKVAALAANGRWKNKANPHLYRGYLWRKA